MVPLSHVAGSGEGVSPKENQGAAPRGRASHQVAQLRVAAFISNRTSGSQAGWGVPCPPWRGIGHPGGAHSGGGFFPLL